MLFHIYFQENMLYIFHLYWYILFIKFLIFGVKQIRESYLMPANKKEEEIKSDEELELYIFF